jgi:CBS domain-containing protein
MTVGRICSRVVVFAEPEETVEAVARRMAEGNLGSLVVVDPARRPLGLLSDRDLVTRVLGAGKDPKRIRVSEVMSAPALSVHEDTPIEDALQRMAHAAMRRLVVVNREGVLVGLLSVDDVHRLLAEEHVAIGKLLARQVPI